MAHALDVLRIAARSLAGGGRGGTTKIALNLQHSVALAKRIDDRFLRRRYPAEVVGALAVLVDALTDPDHGDLPLASFVRAVRDVRRARAQQPKEPSR
jgi:hypothetical protein